MDLEGGAAVDRAHQGRWRNFSAEVSSILASFDKAKEWADVINSLNELQRVLVQRRYEMFDSVPEKLVLCKRLAQSFNPSLPAGVHMSALDTYDCVLQKVGARSLAADLPLYSLGLFPLFSSAATQCRRRLLEIYEKYYLTIGPAALSVCCDGLVLSLLFGLEEENAETFPATLALLDALLSRLRDSPEVFYKALWKAVRDCPQARVGGFNYIKARFPRSQPVAVEDPSSPMNAMRSRITVAMLGGSVRLFTSAIAACLEDTTSPAYRRSALDCLFTTFRLHERGCLGEPDKVALISSMLPILSLNELSSLRRLYNWIGGGDAWDEDYFAMYGAHFVSKAVRETLEKDPHSLSFDPLAALKSLMTGANQHSMRHAVLPDVLWPALRHALR
eukprot:RCo031835